jgi:exosome complex component RRP41
MAAFSTGERRRRGKIDRRTTELSAVIRNTLQQTIIAELLPRTQIDVFVQVLQADGGTRCACINAAFLALAAAGVPMRDVVASCAAGYLDSTPLLDMNYMEDSGGGPDVAVALHPGLDRVVLLQADSRMSLEVLERTVELAAAGCKAVAAFMKETLLQHTKALGAARDVGQRLHMESSKIS